MNIAADSFFNIEILSHQGDLGNLIRSSRLASSYARYATNWLNQAKKAEYLLAQTERLIKLADSIYRQRRFGPLEYIGKLLLQSKHSGAGEYYLALVAKNKGFTKQALVLVEKAAASFDARIRAKAFLTMGAILREQDRFDESHRFRLQALRLASQSNYCEPLVAIEAQRAIAIIKSINGDHHSAVADIERLLPMARVIGKQQPGLYYDLLNSFAVELDEVGRADEAIGAINIALASPFAAAYPEWRETRAEIEQKKTRANRSFIAFFSVSPLKRNNVIQMPTLDNPPLAGRAMAEQPAKVINLDIRRAEMAKQQETKEQPENENFREKRQELVEFVFDEADALRTEDIEKVLEQLKESARKRRSS